MPDAGTEHPLLTLPEGYRDLSMAWGRLAQIPLGGRKDPKRLLYVLCEAVEVGAAAGGAADIVTLFDGVDRDELRLFNGEAANGLVRPGSHLLMNVRRREVHGRPMLSNADLFPPWAHGRVLPLRKGASGHASALAAYEECARLVADRDGALAEAEATLRSRLPGRPRAYLRRAGGDYADYAAWLRDLHVPPDAERGMAARACGLRLAAMDLLVRAEAGVRKDAAEPLRLDVDEIGRAVADIERHSGFRLSGDQRRAVDGLADALAAGDGRILLHGEVGSGKTFVFLPVAAAAARTGRTVHVVSPNRLLAAQTHAVARGSYPDLEPAMVASGRKRHGLAECRLAIGTQALMNAQERPDLGIIDEEQKLGAAQKRRMEAARLVEVSATPLPRTLAAARIGGRRLLSLPARSSDRRIECRVEEPEAARAIMAAIRRDLAKGVNVAVIYPHATEGYGSVDEASERWRRALPGDVVSLHGRMGESERNRALLRLLHPSKEKAVRGAVLIATSILEIGVTLPNLRRMVVYGPDRHGAASLHQMRGRLCRQGGQGTMHLLLPRPSSKMPEAAMGRLGSVAETLSGEDIAEADADRRGLGELQRMGMMQSGRDRSPLLAGAEPSLGDLMSVMRPERGRAPSAPAA